LDRPTRNLFYLAPCFEIHSEPPEGITVSLLVYLRTGPSVGLSRHLAHSGLLPPVPLPRPLPLPQKCQISVSTVARTRTIPLLLLLLPPPLIPLPISNFISVWAQHRTGPLEIYFPWPPALKSIQSRQRASLSPCLSICEQLPLWAFPGI
jgi:hypothetical protein